HRPALQFDPTRIEAFLLEEALVHRDVARDMQADAADDLADRDLGLRLRRTTPERQRDNRGQGGRPQNHHRLILPIPPYAAGVTRKPTPQRVGTSSLVG